MPLELKKSDAKNVDSLKAFISLTLNMNLHGWELYIDMQPVTISISSYMYMFWMYRIRVKFITVQFCYLLR